MDMETVGWIVLGWFTVALVISFALGGFLRQTSASMGEDELTESISKQKVLRYMRSRKPKITLASNSQRMPGKRSTG